VLALSRVQGLENRSKVAERSTQQLLSKISMSTRKLVKPFIILVVFVVGDGAYSQVFQVTRKSDHKEYALK
jgi:hypothetical protein